jgi:hypothetical protein
MTISYNEELNLKLYVADKVSNVYLKELALNNSFHNNKFNPDLINLKDNTFIKNFLKLKKVPKHYVGLETFDYNKIIAIKYYFQDFLLKKSNNNILLNYNILLAYTNSDIIFYNKKYGNKICQKKIKYSTRIQGLGHLYAETVSLQHFSNELRYFLINQDYEIFKNFDSECRILVEYGIKNKLKIPYLIEYLTNQAQILKKKKVKDNLPSISAAKKRIFSAIRLAKKKALIQGYFCNLIAPECELIRNHLFENLLNNFVLIKNYYKMHENDFDTKKHDFEDFKIKLQILYCQTQETLFICKLHNFLSKNLLKKFKKFNTVNSNSSVNSLNQPVLSFIPFFDSVYIQITNSDLLNINIEDLINKFNHEQINSGSILFFFKNKLKTENFKYFNIKILSNYYLIIKFLTTCSTIQYYRLLKRLNLLRKNRISSKSARKLIFKKTLKYPEKKLTNLLHSILLKSKKK